jgi:carbon monoxide dehydrogenase subunit G
MRIANEVPVDASPGAVFGVVTDAQRVVRCLPGAALQGREGDVYSGAVRVEVGPVTAVYRGTVRRLSVDGSARRLVLDARGRDENGSGDAEARVEVRVDPDPQGTGSRLHLDADLLVRGPVARIGRGVLGEVSRGLTVQFARNVDELLTAEPVTDRAMAGTGGAAASDDGGGLPGFRGSGRDVRPLLARVAAAVLVAAALGAVGARLRAPVRRMVRRRR